MEDTIRMIDIYQTITTHQSHDFEVSQMPIKANTTFKIDSNGDTIYDNDLDDDLIAMFIRIDNDMKHFKRRNMSKPKYGVLFSKNA
jgi:hypothetical protein